MDNTYFTSNGGTANVRRPYLGMHLQAVPGNSDVSSQAYHADTGVSEPTQGPNSAPENMTASTTGPRAFWNAAQLPRTGSGAHYPPFPPGSTVADPRSFEENGRTWQNYRPDRYYLPNDAIEQDRLDFTHRAFVLLLDGALALAPFRGDPARVLDIGTGTGTTGLGVAFRERPALTRGR